MPTRLLTEEPLAPELEAIAVAAAEELCRLMDENHEGEQGPSSSLCRAASAAIAAGVPLAAIAHAERVGQTRARHELGSDVLRRVERAARRKREADDEYAHAIARAARLGLPHREIAAAAHVAHGTIRAIVARRDNGSDNQPDAEAPLDTNGPEPAHASMRATGPASRAAIQD